MEEVVVPQAEKLYERLSAALFLALIVVVLFTFQDYGASWDEEGQHLYGGTVFDFYTSFGADRSALSIGDNLSLYGGFFEVISYAATRISPLGIYETRHLLSAFCGILGILGCWRLARLLAGSRAAFWAALLLVFYPSYYGHMFINSKDIPFAALYVWSLYYLVRLLLEFPVISLKSMAKLGLIIGLAMGVRVGGLLLLCYVYLFTGLYMVTGGVARSVMRVLTCWIVTTVIAYGVMLAFWPYALSKPLKRPLEALGLFAHYNNGSSTRDWVLRHLAFKLPEHVWLLIAIGGAFAIMALASKKRGSVIANSLLVFAVIFPIAYAFVVKAYLYDEARHFLFVIPVLFCLAGMTSDRLAEWLAHRHLLASLVMVAVVAYLYFFGLLLVQLHPYEYAYYNHFIGGVEGAYRKGYETEYWATSYKEAVEQLENYLRLRDGAAFDVTEYTIQIKSPEFAATYYFPRNFHEVHENAEFVLSTTRYGFSEPRNARRIVQVGRFEVPFTVVDEIDMTESR